jgi:4-diphosphocytidyl-2-C-methyl-D-erythritol kinase
VRLLRCAHAPTFLFNCQTLSLTLTLPAFAKINLSLRVIGKRDDGYHDLDTIFQTISLHDTLTVSALEEPHIVLSCDDRTLPTNHDNLIIRAANALQFRFGSTRGARIRLQKRIPIQAGLGGGSSDAAVTLIGLSRLWKLDLTKHELPAISAELGADVSFFLSGGTVRATGIGDQVESPGDVAEKFLLIIKPNANISTDDAYKALDERSLTSRNAKIILSTSEANEVFDKFASLTNDFEAVAFDLEPEIRRAKNALLTSGATAALLAGSGSAVFGIFDNEDAQRRAIQAIELETGWRVFPCKTVTRAEYAQALALA